MNQLNMSWDINIVHFKIEVQKDAYFGHLVKKNVFKHQTIDLGYMRQQQVMTDLVDRFQQMGLANDYPMFYEPAHLGIARSFGGTQGLSIILQ